MLKYLKLFYRLHRIQRTKGRIDTNSLEWFALRNLRLMLDWYECQRTGQKAHNIQEFYQIGFHCHHINPIYNGGSNKLSNLETVTKDVHYKIHPYMAGK